MLDIYNIVKVYRNLDINILIDEAIKNENATLSSSGALMVDTGKFTGRSPKDKYFVNSDKSNKNISWGKINKPISQDIYKSLLEISKKQLSNKELYVSDVYCSSNMNSRKSIRFISELAWQSHFVQNMFIVPSKKELENFKPDITVYNACKTHNPDWEKQNLNSENYVVFNIEKNEIIIGGTWYAGEMKKGIFTMMNYHLPLESKLTMHCSANVGKNDDVALFFGLSGTGKTTLSTDSKRALIGDDEHGWDDDGIFNLEGGCYAKLINLSEEHEPEIFNAIRKGAVVENVVANEKGVIDFSDDSKTKNTRVSYPLSHIKNIQKDSKAGHPKSIIFLSADAFGVLPPVSKLDKEQIMYYFLSGYTAKVAGTEIGIKEPIATFSACFGEAFLPLAPSYYAKLLKEKIEKHNVNVYLVNTGWVGGAYGIGKRISIKNTRACIDNILNGNIEKSEFETLEVFNLAIPKTLNGVDTNILNPRNTWSNKKDYDIALNKLANMYKDNFKKYSI